MPLIRRAPPNETPKGTPSETAGGSHAAGVPAAAEFGPSDVLRTGTAGERWAAARALGAPSNEVDAAHGTNALAGALITEADPRVREAIFTSLVRIGSRESVNAVVPFLRVDDANLRTGALDALRAMIGAVRPVLPSLLADPDADVRLLACDLARDLPSADATRLMCEVLARDTEANVCAAAVDVLVEIGEKEALPYLRECAGRFADVTFLIFAVTIAIDRIVSRGPGDGADDRPESPGDDPRDGPIDRSLRGGGPIGHG